MATRSTIAIQNENGTIKAVYCHWDGYLSHNGKILLESYNTEARVRELLSYGSISSLGHAIGEKHSFDKRDGFCTFYGRDRGEKGTDGPTFQDMESWLSRMGEEYNYLFVPGTGWLVCEEARTFSRLADELLIEQK